MFFDTYKNELIISAIVLFSFLLIKLITTFAITRIAKKNGIITPRIRLMRKYISVTLILIVILIETFVFGAGFKELAVVFSSVFAILGIALFAVWSILSNVTSGVIMFFSFPYKVGDKVKIHDKDIPTEAIIEDIRAFQLNLRLDNGDLVTYPNNLMLQRAVTLVEKDAMEVEDDGADIV
ncbi:mechanosensitive ion channel protein MscS [Flavivirga aquatica]|uniref:Mechanosensitive ion channel protein MscS n=1 Tax=Flavivirga aquatica TaxID=1849968 RepID=A0A1E5SHD3_9FLAO|nr:mechanosensitive ion channel domain-containing protein [Flavivirga aquatica]OEJ98531.1 mechanosensitive ion channel protein MscS [Flavivirga aquatica]